MTCLPFTIWVILSTSCVQKSCIFHSHFRPQMFLRKLPIICVPLGVCVTSGWNCTPYRSCRGSAHATHSELSEYAIEHIPGGSFVTLSPWLIQTSSLLDRPAKRLG